MREIISRKIDAGSIVGSDGWLAHKGLENQGIKHHVVINKNNFVTETGAHENRMKSSWDEYKNVIGPLQTKHGTNFLDIQRICFLVENLRIMHKMNF